MKQTIRGSATSETGELFAVATKRTANAVYRFHEDSWENQLTWEGAEVVGCAWCRGSLVCPALDGMLYVVSGSQLIEKPLPSADLWINCCVTYGDEVLMSGGSGTGLVRYHVPSGTVEKQSFATAGLPRPGRRVSRLRVIDNCVYLTGQKTLLWKYDGSRFHEIVDRKEFGELEIHFEDVAIHGGQIYVTALVNTANRSERALVVIDGSTNKRYPDPAGVLTRATRLAVWQDELILFNETVLIGQVNVWRTFDAHQDLSGIIAVHGFPDGRLAAINYEGMAFIGKEGAMCRAAILERR